MRVILENMIGSTDKYEQYWTAQDLMRIIIGQWSDGSFWSSGYGYWILDSTKLEDDKEMLGGSFWSWMKPSWSILEPLVL